MTDRRRWLITGVSSGIGAALAEAVLACGDTVIGCGRNDDALERFEQSASGRAIGVRLDMSRTEDVRAAISKVIAQERLDVVVSNAGQAVFGAFEETSIDEVKALFDINVFGPWALAQAVLPHFREQGTGQLVHISSGAGLAAVPGMSAYSASKFALEGFSDALAQEIATFGIRLLLVEPGAVATRFISHNTHDADRRMSEYGFLSGQGKAVLDAYYAEAALPAAEVAEAILRALAIPDHPTRLLVGNDVKGIVAQKGEQFLALAHL